MENGGEDATLRPWVWVLWLFMGPTLNSICQQLITYVQVRSLVHRRLYGCSPLYFAIQALILVHTEGIITQLVFEHALRIRVKSEKVPESSGDIMLGPGTTETSSISGNTVVEPSTAASSAASSVKGKNKAQNEETMPVTSATRTDQPERQSQKSSDKLLGRINNLVSNDLGNITDARNFMRLSK